MSVYTTKTIGKNIAQVEDFIINEEPMARLVFRAQIHPDGVRGRLIRQRRISRDDMWTDDTPIDIRSLEKGQSFNVELKTVAIEKLFHAIGELKGHVETNGIDNGVNSYKTVNAAALLIDDGNLHEVIANLISGNHSQEVLKAFSESKDINLRTFTDIERVKRQRKAIDELEQRLTPNSKFAEVGGGDSWQKFILNENWMFGANYLDPIDRTKINIAGSMPDYLYPTADGFADILEIKLPNDEVIVMDKSHTGSWKWSTTTNTAIGQVTNYLVDIDRLRLEIEREIKIKTKRDVLLLKPRAYILIGNSIHWDAPKKEALRKLNSILHGIEVITYEDLRLRAIRIVES